MPLEIEAFIKGRWKNLGIRSPEDVPGSIASIGVDGKRQVYVFRCAKDGSHSTVLRSRAGVDIEQGAMRKIDSEGFELVANLAPGQTYSMSIRQSTKPVGALRSIRFRHT